MTYNGLTTLVYCFTGLCHVLPPSPPRLAAHFLRVGICVWKL